MARQFRERELLRRVEHALGQRTGPRKDGTAYGLAISAKVKNGGLKLSKSAQNICGALGRVLRRA